MHSTTRPTYVRPTWTQPTCETAHDRGAYVHWCFCKMTLKLLPNYAKTLTLFLPLSDEFV